MRKKPHNSLRKRIGIMGHYAFGKELLNGQTIKTKNVTQALEETNCFEIIKVDTHGGALKLFLLPFRIIWLLSKCSDILIFPAHRGIKIIVPLLTFFNYLFKKRLHYCVIGGWLPSFLTNKPHLVKKLKSFRAIYVETSVMKDALEKILGNVFVLPNFKNLNILSENELCFQDAFPLPLCTFSRVMKEKGIEDAILAVNKINEESGNTLFCLDIYGEIDPSQADWFKALEKEFLPFVRYKGAIPSNKSVDVIKKYYALLFPTHFYTEGVPGTIIDSFAAGVPVICSKWESFGDVVEEGKTGVGYHFGDESALLQLLRIYSKNCNSLNNMKKECLKKAHVFLPQSNVNILIDQMTDIH